MATARIADMTFDELRRFVLALMEEQRLEYLFGDFDMDEADLTGLDDEPDNRTLEEILESIERNRWTPPSGTPSPSQLIREDRDSR